MWRAVKFLFQIAVLAGMFLAGYAMLADLPPPTREIVVELPVPGTGGQ